MKKYLFLLASVCLCCTLVSCGGDEPDEDISLSVTLTSGTRTSYILDASATSMPSSISFLATSAWTASVDATGGADWLTLSAYSGGAGNQALRATVQPNETTSLRTAHITISGANNTIYITVSQRESAAAPSPTAEGVDKSDWTLVWSDEFDGADGSQPSSDKWVRSTRYSSTWNRYISDSEDVIFIRDGKLVARAIPNPDPSSDNVPMLTGAIETRSKFEFTYGLVSVKAKTNPFAGSFPAIWMMPAPPTQSWPAGGEIDIWEQINTEATAYHTIHSRWRDTLGNANNPASSFTTTVNYANYHVYELEWTEDRISWYVDGSRRGTYQKSTSQSALDNGQWPFNAPFYLILNQSVGDGSWASNPNTSHTYETLFEYARVYQK